MKTFNEEDLITWANRDMAIIGNKYYFADSLIGMKSCINNNCSIYTLDYIAEENICAPFNCKDSEGNLSYACLLPVDKVIEEEPEKKYRPLKNIKELYELIFNIVRNSEIFGIEDKSEETCICELISDCVVHLRSKSHPTEYYGRIISIAVEESGVKIYLLHNTYYENFSDLFEEFEIKINGKWQPFGVLQD